MKTIVIEEDCWWDSNGCDCCESTRMEYFTSSELSYTPNTEEACLVDLLEKYNPLLEEEMKLLYTDYMVEVLMSNKEFLYSELEKVGIIIEFSYMEEES